MGRSGSLHFAYMTTTSTYYAIYVNSKNTNNVQDTDYNHSLLVYYESSVPVDRHYSSYSNS